MSFLKFRSSLRLVFLICLVALLGCGPEDEGENQGENQNQEENQNQGENQNQNQVESEPLDRLTLAPCQRQADCCPGNDDTLEECQDRLELALGVIFTKDSIDVDFEAVDACIAQIEEMDCETVAAYGGIVPILRACESFYEGTLELGETCGVGGLRESLFGSDECLSGFCSDNVCAERPAPAELGEECSGPDSCVEGASCLLGECREELDEGEDCSQAGLCLGSLQCVREEDHEFEMVCIEPTVIDIGEECVPGTVCVLGEGECRCPLGEEGCLWGVCGNTSRCML